MNDPRHGSDDQVIRVLLIEDDAEQAQLLQRWIERAGRYLVVHAASGPEGEVLIRRAEWDIVISDIELPGVSGLALLRLSKEVMPHTPTLLVTAHESVNYALDALRGRADDLLIKPLNRDPFLAKVAELVAAAAAAEKTRSKVVLAIGAHPDDVEIGCGGILLRHRKNGDRVSVLTLSGGELGGVAPERIDEARRAAETLGARLFLRDLRDAAISEGPETIEAIGAVIREIEPTIVYTHTLHDGHQDHRSVHRATIVAARTVPSLYCYQAPSTGIEFQPTRFVEIGEFLDLKVEAIGAYRSQVVKRPYLRESLLRATAEYWGRFAGYGFVEPLEVIRERG